MKRRRIVSIAGGVSLGVALPVLGQTPPKVHRIGFLAARSRSTPANPDVYSMPSWLACVRSAWSKARI